MDCFQHWTPWSLILRCSAWSLLSFLVSSHLLNSPIQGRTSSDPALASEPGEHHPGLITRWTNSEISYMASTAPLLRPLFFPPAPQTTNATSKCILEPAHFSFKYTLDALSCWAPNSLPNSQTCGKCFKTIDASGTTTSPSFLNTSKRLGRILLQLQGKFLLGVPPTSGCTLI